METPRGLARAFVAAEKRDQVARLIDFGRALGFPDNRGISAKIVGRFGHGRRIIDAVAQALFADGDPWEYAMKVLSNGKDHTPNTRTRAGAAAHREGTDRERW